MLEMIKKRLAYVQSNNLFDAHYINDMQTLIRMIESHGPEGRNRTNAEYVELLQKYELKESEYQSAINKANDATKLAREFQAQLQEAQQALEWIKANGYGEQFNKASRALERMKPYGQAGRRYK